MQYTVGTCGEMMFDAYLALKHLDGVVWGSAAEMRRALEEVMKQHPQDLPIDFHVVDFVNLIRRQDWLRTTSSGIVLHLKKAEAGWMILRDPVQATDSEERAEMEACAGLLLTRWLHLSPRGRVYGWNGDPEIRLHLYVFHGSGGMLQHQVEAKFNTVKISCSVKKGRNMGAPWRDCDVPVQLLGDLAELLKEYK